MLYNHAEFDSLLSGSGYHLAVLILALSDKCVKRFGAWHISAAGVAGHQHGSFGAAHLQAVKKLLPLQQPV